VLLDGRVDILAVTPTGTRRLNTLSKGAYFGEVSLLGGSKVSARVAVIAKCSLLRIAPDKFEHFLQSRPSAANRVYRLFAENLAERVRALSVK
jgi:CRP-like cAMP-binding protein